MHDVWASGMTISGTKSAIGVPGITIVGMVCDYDGCHPEQKKLKKIVDRPEPWSTRDARMFIGIVVYYHIFIAGFGPYFYFISEKMYDLIGPGSVNWQWTSSNDDLLRP